MDNCVAVVPVKHVTKPGPKDLSVGKQCDVKWSTGKPLAAVLLAIGKHHFQFIVVYVYILCSLHVYICAGDKCTVEQQEKVLLEEEDTEVDDDQTEHERNYEHKVCESELTPQWKVWYVTVSHMYCSPEGTDRADEWKGHRGER